MSGRSSSSRSITTINQLIRVSDTLRRSFDRSHPEFKWGEAYLFEHLTISPGLWLCLGTSNNLLDTSVWYFSRTDRVWFAIGLPVAVWRDAVVLESSVPGRLLVIPNKMFSGKLSRRFRIQRIFLSHWLPSMSKYLDFQW
jgi:hypothetical protein